MSKTEKLELGRDVIEIDPSNLKFDEATLSNYIQKESGWYDYFGAKMALAEKYLALKDAQFDQIYSERFAEFKDMGGSDKLAEARAKADDNVVTLKGQLAEAKYKVTRLKQHLRAWDKSHDNAQSMGHMVRKQMDKMNSEIMAKVHNVDTSEMMIDHAVNQTVEHVDNAVKDSGPQFEDGITADNLF